MRTRTTSTAVAMLTLTLLAVPRQAPAQAASGGTPFARATQLVLVITGGWDGVNGTIRRFERAAPSGAWRQVGAPSPIVVGTSGMGWGRGLVDAGTTGPTKREGDGRAPAGVFSLSTAFGEAARPPAAWQVPYRPLGHALECVDDAASAAYNRLVTRADAGSARWASSEKMWEEPLYKWGIVVDHNLPVPVPGAGSCIFLHLWNGPDRGMAGCTAMPESTMVDLLGWLVPERHPILVQLPRGEFDRLKARWGLPEVE